MYTNAPFYPHEEGSAHEVFAPQRLVVPLEEGGSKPLSPHHHIQTGMFTIDVAPRSEIENVSRQAQEMISFYNNGKMRSRPNGSKHGSILNNLSTMANSSDDGKSQTSKRGRTHNSTVSRTIEDGSRGRAIRVDGERP